MVTEAGPSWVDDDGFRIADVGKGEYRGYLMLSFKQPCQNGEQGWAGSPRRNALV